MEKIVKIISTDVLTAKEKTQDLCRKISAMQFATATQADKDDICTILENLNNSLTNIYQVNFITLTYSPATALEFVSSEMAHGGFSPGQLKLLKEINKKQAAEKEKNRYNQTYNPNQ